MPEVFAAERGLRREPGETQRVHGRLRARVGEAHLVHAGAQVDQAFGDFDLQRMRVREERAVRHGLGDARVYALIGVAEDDGAKG